MFKDFNCAIAGPQNLTPIRSNANPSPPAPTKNLELSPASTQKNLAGAHTCIVEWTCMSRGPGTVILCTLWKPVLVGKLSGFFHGDCCVSRREPCPTKKHCCCKRKASHSRQLPSAALRVTWSRRCAVGAATRALQLIRPSCHVTNIPKRYLYARRDRSPVVR